MTARGADPIREVGAEREPARDSARLGEPFGSDHLLPAEPLGVAMVALPGLATAASAATAAATAPAAGTPPPAAGPSRQAIFGLGARPKLIVGAAEDQAERDADAMAAVVVRRLAGSGGGAGADLLGSLRRAAAHAPVSRSAATGPARPGIIGRAGGTVDPDTERALQAAKASGTPLAPAVRREYESAFDADFGAVRVHSGAVSAGLNATLGAKAFTIGADIFFGDRVPDTSSPADRHLLAHELAHTLQDASTAHRAVVRRLATQITPSWGEDSEDEAMGPQSGSDPALGSSPATSAPRAKTRTLFIEAVAIVGRPPRLFGSSMGDHTTAFVVSRKGVENALVDQPFDTAVKELDEMVAELTRLPGWALIDSLKPTGVVQGSGAGTQTGLAPAEAASALPSTVSNTTDATAPATGSAGPSGPQGKGADEDAPVDLRSHHARLISAQQHLQASRVLLEAADNDDLKVIRLQDYVSAYLELRELIPLSVSNWFGANRRRGGKGDGESALAGFPGEPGKQRPGQLRRDFLSTVSTYRIAEAALEPNRQALALLMPGLDPRLNADERTDLMARQHVQSVLTNFPQNFAGLAQDILQAEGTARASRKKGGGSSVGADERTDEDTDEPTDEENFAIILNHLVRIVRMRYPEVAEAERQQRRREELYFAKTDPEQARMAARDAEAFEPFLPTAKSGRGKKPALEEKSEPDTASAPSAPTPGKKKAAKSRVPKRGRDPESDTDEDDDDPYQRLSPEQASKVYTGRDGFTDRKSSAAAPADLAVQLLLDDTGAIAKLLVGRQGRHTKGAHTVPWMQWVIWLGAEITGKQPQEALTAFRTITVPLIRARLDGREPPAPAPAKTDVMLLDGPVEESKEESKEAEIEAEASTADPTPLMVIQIDIAALLDEITDHKDSSVLDATDTGGKGEAHYRRELAGFEAGQRKLTPVTLVRHILALCDVGEASPELAARTVSRTMAAAKKDFPKAYAASQIASYDLADLVDQATSGKDGGYGDDDAESSRKKKGKKKGKKSHNDKDGSV